MEAVWEIARNLGRKFARNIALGNLVMVHFMHAWKIGNGS